MSNSHQSFWGSIKYEVIVSLKKKEKERYPHPTFHWFNVRTEKTGFWAQISFSFFFLPGWNKTRQRSQSFSFFSSGRSICHRNETSASRECLRTNVDSSDDDSDDVNDDDDDDINDDDDSDGDETTFKRQTIFHSAKEEKVKQFWLILCC